MTSIGDISEDQLIAMFAPRLPSTDQEILGPGDDAAVLALDGHLVVSSDVLVQEQHFRTQWSSGADVGWRAAVQNLADIDAMGAVPTALQISLCAPPATPVQWVLDFADGVREACEPHGVGVTGGDLSSAPQIVIAVTALGETHGIETVTRADAAPGDVIAVSGGLGAAAAGLAQLVGGLEAEPAAIALFKRPQPRIGAGLEAALLGASALMDISDGLLRDATRMAHASEAVFSIDSQLVPVHPAAAATAKALGADPLVWALTGGEDHMMLATFPNAERIPASWTVVGAVERGEPGVLVDGQAPAALGWDHFGG